jgi:hypothetical protein
VSYVKSAFLIPGHLVALAVMGGVAAFSREPLAGGAVALLECLYLAVVSSAPAFRRAVRARVQAKGQEPEARVVAMLEDLAPSQREHYFLLRELRDKILANHRRLPGGRVLAASSEPRVDALLTSFLRLLQTLNGYRKYLNTRDRKAVEVELTELQGDAASETNPRLKEVKSRRADILGQRLERFRLAEESRELVSHQLASIEDLLRLTHEQSIAIRDPESINRQLEALTVEVKSTEETVREMERFMDFHEEIAASLPHGERTR